MSAFIDRARHADYLSKSRSIVDEMAAFNRDIARRESARRERESARRESIGPELQAQALFKATGIPRLRGESASRYIDRLQRDAKEAVSARVAGYVEGPPEVKMNSRERRKLRRRMERIRAE